MIFDSHAHYDDEAFDTDREELLAQCQAQGIEYIVNVSASLASVKTTLELARKHPFIYAAVGVHPDEVGELNEENFAWLKEQCQDPKVVAVGETGLDYYWDKENHEVQKYCSIIDLFYSPCVLMVNEDLYNSWTDEQRAAFDQAAEEAKDAERAISQQMNNDSRANMEADGVIFTDVDKDVWKAAVQSVYEDASLNIDQELLAQIQEVTGA